MKEVAKKIDGQILYRSKRMNKEREREREAKAPFKGAKWTGAH